MLNYKKKKGQVSDTMTWIIATLIIVVILLVFIWASSIISEARNVERFAKSRSLDEDSGEKIDWIGIKTSFAYEINNQNKVSIDKWIKENED